MFTSYDGAFLSSILGVVSSLQLQPGGYTMYYNRFDADKMNLYTLPYRI